MYIQGESKLEGKLENTTVINKAHYYLSYTYKVIQNNCSKFEEKLENIMRMKITLEPRVSNAKGDCQKG